MRLNAITVVKTEDNARTVTEEQFCSGSYSAAVFQAVKPVGFHSTNAHTVPSHQCFFFFLQILANVHQLSVKDELCVMSNDMNLSWESAAIWLML